MAAISWPLQVITTGISDVHFTNSLQNVLKLELKLDTDVDVYAGKHKH